jgi:diphthine-ammonia ligase
MRTVALVSGGKDSCYNMLLCQRYGHSIVALANLKPTPHAGLLLLLYCALTEMFADEMDSFMYQTVGHEVIDAFAAAMELPLYRATILGGLGLLVCFFSSSQHILVC